MSYGGIIGQQPALEANGIAYNNSQTSSIITGDNVQTAIDQLFTSVSNGKNKIASAITDKGVSTSPNNSFDVMAGNIGKIQSYDINKVNNFCNFTGSNNLNNILDTISIISLESGTGRVHWQGSMRYEPYQGSCANNVKFKLNLEPLLGDSYTEWGGIEITYNIFGEIDGYTSTQTRNIQNLSVLAWGDSTNSYSKISYYYPYDGGKNMKIKFSFNLLRLNAKFDISISKDWPVAK